MAFIQKPEDYLVKKVFFGRNLSYLMLCKHHFIDVFSTTIASVTSVN